MLNKNEKKQIAKQALVLEIGLIDEVSLEDAVESILAQNIIAFAPDDIKSIMDEIVLQKGRVIDLLNT